MIMMRPATPADSDLLFAWRNDPGTQAASRSTAPVPREDHERWMQFNVAYGYPQHLVMIADSDIGSLGVVRFDMDKADVLACEVSITIAPEHRGKGMAKDILSQACGYMHEYRIDAEVKHENIGSRRLFERCGFEEIGRSSGYLRYRMEPVR
jgi:RimJ/RimL family protein N-acetyltransferase